MTTRQFDPVLSAALRNELEALADRAEAPVRRRPVALRPQVWITAVTAILLVVATLGVLRLTGGTGEAPVGGGALVDPLVAKGGPTDDPAVRSTPVSVLAEQDGRGPTSVDVVVPADSSRLLVYLTCAPQSRFELRADRGFFSGPCTPGTATGGMTAEPSAGAQSVQVQVPAGTRFSLLVLAIAPSSTTTLSTLQVDTVPASVADPLEEILDPKDDAYIRHEADVLLHVSGTGSGTWTMSVPDGVTSIRPYANCSAGGRYELGIDGEPRATSAACESTYGGSFADIPVTPGSHSVSITVPKGAAFALVVIATPVYTPSTSGAAKAPLPYPSLAAGQVLAQERGDAEVVRGRLSGSMRGVNVVVTCEGEGAVTVATDFGTLGSPADFSGCGATTATSGGGGMSGQELVKNPRYTITPYGDVRWTVTFMRLSD